MDYPSARADSLELFVRRRVNLSGKARHVYAALRWMEAGKSGFCRPVFAGYRTIADESAIDVTSVKSALQELQASGLCEVTIGRPIKSERQATSIRRRTLDEIKTHFTEGDDDAHRLATELSARDFRFSGKVIKPCWTVARTGRVCSSRPNFQGLAAPDRRAGLAAGLSRGECLVHADVRQAEPTVIKHLLRIPLERDLYQEYMDAVACSRVDAKRAINTLAYCKNTLACFTHWPPQARTMLADYVNQLSEYKAMLFAESRKSRSVTTFTGRSIFAEKGARLHPGIPMNWRVQGTVADIVNATCLRLLDSVRIVLPVHDAVYVVIPREKAEIVKALLSERAREVGLTIQVQAESLHAG